MSAAAESIITAIDAIAERVSQRCVEPNALEAWAAENTARRNSRLVANLERSDKIAVLAAMKRLDRVLAARLGQPHA